MPERMIDAPELPVRAVFYPYGFPAEVRTNAESVPAHFRTLWGDFVQEHHAEPLRCDVQVVQGESTNCPPPPKFRLMLPLMACVADADNYSILDLDNGTAAISVTEAALEYPLWVQYFLLGSTACCIATRLATPVHAGCVSLGGRGVLLCGDSGAGKSTLSYACARNGWVYTSDDGSYLLDGGKERRVTGNCYRIRFRPSAAELFPELAGLRTTPRAAGKPSIELSTTPMGHITRSQTTRVDFIVFLKRGTSQTPQLAPYDRERARQSMRRVLYGSPASLAAQYAATDRLLGADLFELQYGNLDSAVDRLGELVRQGH